MRTGKVKWFNDTRGYGFISDDQGGEEVFCHYKVVEMEGFKTLKEGQPVAYEAHATPMGLKASKVVPQESTKAAA
jgi:CspA family cold shock protein